MEKREVPSMQRLAFKNSVCRRKSVPLRKCALEARYTVCCPTWAFGHVCTMCQPRPMTTLTHQITGLTKCFRQGLFGQSVVTLVAIFTRKKQPTTQKINEWLPLREGLLQRNTSNLPDQSLCDKAPSFSLCFL